MTGKFIMDYILGLHMMSGPLSRAVGKQARYQYVSMNRSDKERGVKLGTIGVSTSPRIRGGSFVLLPFPVDGRKPRFAREYNSKALTPLSGTPFIYNHKVEEIGYITRQKIQAAADYVRRFGSMSWIMTLEGADRFLSTEAVHLRKMYKHTTGCYHSKNRVADMRIHSDDVVVPVVTLFDLKFCIPVFNTRKADGMGVLVSCILPNNSKIMDQPCITAELAFIVSQYKENVYTVDGERIRSRNNISHSALEWARMALTEKVVGPKKKKKEGKAEWKDISTYGYSGSSTATFYYQTSSSTSTAA